MPDQEEAKRILWEKAAKAKPQELEIQMRWFTYAFENDDWKSAQKVRENWWHTILCVLWGS